MTKKYIIKNLMTIFIHPFCKTGICIAKKITCSQYYPWQINNRPNKDDIP